MSHSGGNHTFNVHGGQGGPGGEGQDGDGNGGSVRTGGEFPSAGTDHHYYPQSATGNISIPSTHNVMDDSYSEITAVHHVIAGQPQTPPQELVDDLLDGQSLTDLHDRYLQIVNYAIPIAAHGDQHAQHIHDQTMKILSTTLQLLQPLDCQSLADLLELEKGVLLETLLPLRAVINVSDTPGTAIRIIHPSFREFMTSSYIQEVRPDILCGTDNQRQALVSALIKVLDKHLKFNICDLPTSYLRNIDMPEFQWRLDNYIPLHLRYTAQFWVDHLVTTACDSYSDQVQNLLFKKFLFWLEVLSLLGIVHYGQQALSKLRLWTNESTLLRFATDAKRFVSFFWEAIVQSAPHIYLSALALAPEESEIHKRFSDEFPQLISITTGRMKQWPNAIAVLEGHTDQVTSVAFSPDGKSIVSGSYDTTVHIWDAETGVTLRKPLEGHTDQVTSVAFSPDFKRIVSGSYDKTVCIWDAETGAALMEPLEGHTNWVTSVAFSPEGMRIVSGSYDKTVRIWDAETGAALRKPLEGHTNWVTSVAFSPEGKRIVSGSYDKTARIWDAETGAVLGEPLEGHTDQVTSVTFSPNSKIIASGSYDKTVHIWDAETGAALREPLEGHTDWVTSVAFSSDGKRIVSGSYDKTVHIWDVETGAALGEPLEGHTNWVTSVAFSLDGKRIVSGSYDKTVRIWDAETGSSASGWSLLNSLHLKSPSPPLHLQIHNGWVSCLPLELLFWLPVPFRVGLWSPHDNDTLVTGQEQTLLSYDKFVYGQDWAKCYTQQKSLHE